MTEIINGLVYIVAEGISGGTSKMPGPLAALIMVMFVGTIIGMIDDYNKTPEQRERDYVNDYIVARWE
jgi:hypothetical protein